MYSSFEVGAVFIVEDRSSAGLASIGRAFEKLDEMVLATQDRLKTVGEGAFSALKASVDMAITEGARLITQANEVAIAWERAGRAMAGASGIGTGESAIAGSGPRRGGGGRGVQRTEEEIMAEDAALALRRQIESDRLDANAINRNENQIYSRQEAAAKRENIARDLAAKADDGITIPAPPRTGVTEFHYGQSTPGLRNDMMGLPDVVAKEKELAKAEAEAAKRRERAAGGGNDIIQTIVDYELLHTAFKAAGGEQQSLFRGAKAFNLDPTSEEGQEVVAMLRQTARDAAANTSYKESATAAGIPLLAGPFGLEGKEGAKKFSTIYPGAARAAEGLELLDPANHFSATLPAMMEYSHASRQYEPDQLKRTYDILGAITSLVPHTTFAAEAGAMSYVVPLAKAAGIHPDEAAVMVGTLQQAGLRGTIGATTLRQELVGLTRGGEPMPKTRHSDSLHKETREFEHDLGLQGIEGRAINEATKGNAHQQAMTKVGLFDAKGKRTFLFTAGDEENGLGEKGGVNLAKANQIFAKWASTHSPAEVLQAGNDLFGIRGEMAPTILGQVIKSGETDFAAQFRHNVYTRADQPRGFLESAREQMSKSAPQEFGQVTARFNDILSHLADSTLPAFQGAMEHGLIPFLNKLTNITAPDEKGLFTSAQKIVGGTAVGAAVGGLIGGAAGLLFGGVTVVPGAAVGSLIGGALGGGGTAANEALQRRIGPTPEAVLKGMIGIGSPGGLLPFLAAAVGGNGGSFSPKPAPVVNVTTTVNGVIDERTWSVVLAELMERIKSAISHATTDGHGTNQSRYVTDGSM